MSLQLLCYPRDFSSFVSRCACFYSTAAKFGHVVCASLHLSLWPFVLPVREVFGNYILVSPNESVESVRPHAGLVGARMSLVAVVVPCSLPFCCLVAIGV